MPACLFINNHQNFVKYFLFPVKGYTGRCLSDKYWNRNPSSSLKNFIFEFNFPIIQTDYRLFVMSLLLLTSVLIPAHSLTYIFIGIYTCRYTMLVNSQATQRVVWYCTVYRVIFHAWLIPRFYMIARTRTSTCSYIHIIDMFHEKIQIPKNI